MSNNTINHVSDSSVYVTFNPANTSWPSNVTNVQQALSLIADYARTDVGLPTATENVAGMARIATQADIDAGTDNTKIVTPALLSYRLQNPHASQTVWGYTRYATNAEATTVSNDLVSITPRSLDYVLTNRKATETVWGTTKLSTTAQATAGTDDTTTMTPLKTKQAISALVPVQSDATEAARGLVRLATVAQVQAGTIREGYAISPYTFIRLTATESNLGLLRIATQAEVNAGTDNTKAVTPLKLMTLKGSGTQFGLVRLATTVGTAANTALGVNAAVLPSDRNAVMTSGAVYQGSATAANKYQTFNDLDNTIPIGCVMLSAFNSDRGNLMICNGRGLNTTTYATLFARIGYTFGGSGTTFNLPDMRGVAARGFDGGRGLDSGRAFGSYQADAMQPITGGFVCDVASNAGIGLGVDGAFYDNGWAGTPADKGSINNPEVRKIRFDSARQTRTAAETRMKNVALNYVIRVS